ARYPNEPWHYQHNGTTPAGGITEGLFDMLSDAEQTQLRDRVADIYDVLFADGYGIKWRVKETAERVRDVSYAIDGKETPDGVIENFGAHTRALASLLQAFQAGQLVGGQVDAAAVAAQLAPTLVAALSADLVTDS